MELAQWQEHAGREARRMDAMLTGLEERAERLAALLSVLEGELRDEKKARKAELKAERELWQAGLVSHEHGGSS